MRVGEACGAPGLVCVVEELPVSALEVGILAPVPGDRGAGEGELGVGGAVDRGDRGAGQIGVLTADGDAGAARDVHAVGGGEEFDRAGLDLAGDVAHALPMRGGRSARSRRLVVLDGLLELFELVG